LYVSATQPVEWTDDSSGINFKQLGLFEAASNLFFYWTPHSDYFYLRLAATIYPFSFSFFDNVLTVTLGSLADLTSADGFSVCDTFRWSYDIFKLSFSFTVYSYEWVDSIYDTLFNNDPNQITYVYDPSYGYLKFYEIQDFASRSLISRSGWFGFNNCETNQADASYPW
jgi:hypothetical protein